MGVCCFARSADIQGLEHTENDNAMKRFMKTPVLAPLSLLLLAGWAHADEPPPLSTEREKVSYAIGVNVMSNMKQQGFDVDLDLVARGMKDALSGGKYLLSDEEIRIAIERYRVASRKRQAAVVAQAAIDNRREGEAFLAANKTADGVVVLASGLQYKILKAGDGKKPSDADTVRLKYRGTLVNGTEIDNSDRAKKPQAYRVADTIPGWREALNLMPAGSSWRLFIPPALAYGDRGKSGSIGPNATLIYEMELLSVD